MTVELMNTESLKKNLQNHPFLLSVVLPTQRQPASSHLRLLRTPPDGVTEKVVHDLYRCRHPVGEGS
jgi:hypothetical protein